MWATLCDISRVLMTHMGFVAIVLLAPATMDDQKLITKVFSGRDPGQPRSEAARVQEGGRGEGGGKHTIVRLYPLLALVIHGEPHSPRGKVAQDDGSQSSVHAPYALLAPDDPRSADESVVELGVTDMASYGDWVKAALGLQLGLDDVERAGDDTRCEAADRAGKGVKLGYGSSRCPAFKRRYLIVGRRHRSPRIVVGVRPVSVGVRRRRE